MGDFLIDSLQDSGYNPLTLTPEWDYAEQETALRTAHRSLGGVRRDYQWGPTHRRFTVPLRFVSSADAARMNDWWRQRDDVAFTRNSSEFPSTSICRVVNGDVPFGSRLRPYHDLYQGVLMLEATDASTYFEQPFVLDDDVMGLLDQDYNALG